MTKLLTIKQWVTIDDAISLLSKIFDEKITKNDIYVFVKENKLNLSLFCNSTIKAKKASIHSNPIYSDLPFGGKCETTIFLKENHYLSSDEWDKDTYHSIDGIVDLLTVSCGLPLIEEQLLGINKYALIDEIFIKKSNGEYYWLIDGTSYSTMRHDENLGMVKINKFKGHPISELPDNVTLGVRTSELNLLLDKLLKPNESNKNDLDEVEILKARIAQLENTQEKNLHPRTANNAAKMIGALAEICTLDLTQPQGQANKTIRETLEKLGSSLSKDTVGDWLKQANDQLK